ncbi:MAG: hypothetical protein Q8K05_05200 [Polaromonas sp.]|uniref:hypothetical protein n=1 Tax=Polaromonas sp. TaxID=1869339 RepID=UPI0027312F76|nr:hypothetical protein [Polaromonas sp.]MDP2255446.1 hypothetical protein [Polaromonas sp.]
MTVLFKKSFIKSGIHAGYRLIFDSGPAKYQKPFLLNQGWLFLWASHAPAARAFRRQANSRTVNANKRQAATPVTETSG